MASFNSKLVVYQRVNLGIFLGIKTLKELLKTSDDSMMAISRF